jgi:hypothetical protein
MTDVEESMIVVGRKGEWKVARSRELTFNVGGEVA